MNKVFFSGNLGRDPELKYTAGGKALCEFSLASTRKWGEDQKETTWVDFVAWGGWAECAARFHKGQNVAVEGRLQLDEWEDKETGKKRSRLKVCVEAIAGGPIPRGEGGGGDSEYSGPPDGGRAQAQAGVQQQRPAPQGQQRPAPQGQQLFSAGL